MQAANKQPLLSMVIFLCISITLALITGALASQDENWQLEITATGQNLPGANNLGTAYIGIAETEVSYPTPGFPPNYTVDVKLADDLFKDIRKIGSGREVWIIHLEIGSYADYGLSGYYPQLSWDSEMVGAGRLELRRGNEDGELLVADMSTTTTYQTQEADGDYNSSLDKAFLVYTLIYLPPSLLPRTFYHDQDGDSYGDLNDSLETVIQPPNYVIDHTDCDDTNKQIHPGIAETCDGVDNNCDGIIDDGFSPQFITLPVTEGQVGREYTYTAVINGELPFTSWDLEGEPSWMFWEGNRDTIHLNGLPPDSVANHIYSLSLRVSNAKGIITQNWNLQIQPLHTLAGLVLSDPAIPFDDGNCPFDDGNCPFDDGNCPFDDGNCPALPFRIDIYGISDGLLKASTEPSAERDSIQCSFNKTGGNYDYQVTGMEKGFYTIITSDNDPDDTYWLDELEYSRNYETISKVKYLGLGESVENIPLHIVPPQYWKVKGQIFGPVAIDHTVLTFYGQTDDGQQLKKKSMVSLDQAGSGYYCFFAPTGSYNLLASAGGYENKLVEIPNLLADQNIPDLIFDLQRKTSLSIVAREEEDRHLRLNFLFLSPLGEVVDWKENNEVEMTFFTPEDDPDSTGNPSDPNSPSGIRINLVDPNNLGSEEVFPHRYLTCLIDANSCFMVHLVKDNLHTYQIAARIRVIDQPEAKEVMDPMVHKFEVKGLPSFQKPLSQTKCIFKVDEFPSSADFLIFGNWPISANQDVVIKARVNTAYLETTLLAMVNEQGDKLGMVDQEEQLTLQIELKPQTDDPNCLGVDIRFTNDSGQRIEYNPPDPLTGKRDEEADPIFIDLPLPKSLQGKGYTPQQAEQYVAINPNTDFYQVNSEWRAIAGKYGIYFQTAQGRELFVPGEKEGGEIVISDTGVLMIRVMTNHTSSWFLRLSQAALPPVISPFSSWSIKVGIESAYSPAAQGDPNIIWSMEDSPDGMSINAKTGEIHWLPSQNQVGDYSVILKAENRAGSDSRTLPVSVNPVIVSIPSKSARVGEQYIYSPQVIGEGEINWTLLDWPEGMTIDENSGQITWVPVKEQIQNHTISLKVMVNGKEDTQSWLVKVTDSSPGDGGDDDNDGDSGGGGGGGGGGGCFISIVSSYSLNAH